MSILDAEMADTRDAHSSNGLAADAECPYCGQSISRKQFAEIREQIEDEERARVGKIVDSLRQQFARQQKDAEAKSQAEITKAKRDAAKAAELQSIALRATLDETIGQRLAAQRDVLGKEKADAVAAERTKAFEEKARLQEQLGELQRKLASKTAHQIGEPAEVDLYQALVSAFPDDRVSRVAKGVQGPDVVLEIANTGRRVIIDSKAHAKWSSRFITKLRDDQVREDADFAILSSSAFPKGTRQLHLIEGVIVADPARVVAVITILRRHILQTHLLKLTLTNRQSKADRLLDYIVSRDAHDLFDRLHRTANALVDLEIKEADAHHGIWRKRGELIRSVQQVHEDLTSAVEAIVTDASDVPGAAE